MIFSLVAMTGLEKCCITSAYLQWLCHSGERPVARWPLVFPIYLYRKLKKSSCQKPLDRFPYNFAEMFLWWSSTKIVQAIWICQKTWPPGAGLIFPIYLYRKLKKSSCQKPLDRFPYNFAEMFLWWSSTKIVQAIWICQKTWPPGGGTYFPCISI